MAGNMIVIRDPKTFCFNVDLSEDFHENLKHEIEFIIRSNESLVEIIIKIRLKNYCKSISMETIFINMGNSKMNEPHKLVLNFSQRLDLRRSSDKHVALQNLSTSYTQKNIRKQYTSNKLNIIAPIWNDEFKLPDGPYYVSDIQDYIKYIIKKNETLIAIPPIHVYIN